MNYEFPLTFFTVLSQLAVGLSVFAVLKRHLQPQPAAGASGTNTTAGTTSNKEWVIIFGAAALSLVASIFHLGQPLRAPTALSNLGIAWLSREVLLFGAFAFLAFLCLWLKGAALPALAALVGVVGVAVQGMTYAPVSMPAIHNGFPMVFFALTALVLGAAFAQLTTTDNRFAGVLRTGLLLLLLLLLMVPCVWTSGSAIMQETAAAWLASPPFWGCVASLVAALVLGIGGRAAAPVQCALLLVGAILGRMAFFSATIHSGTHIGSIF